MSGTDDGFTNEQLTELALMQAETSAQTEKALKDTAHQTLAGLVMNALLLHELERLGLVDHDALMAEALRASCVDPTAGGGRQRRPGHQDHLRRGGAQRAARGPRRHQRRPVGRTALTSEPDRSQPALPRRAFHALLAYVGNTTTVFSTGAEPGPFAPQNPSFFVGKICRLFYCRENVAVPLSRHACRLSSRPQSRDEPGPADRLTMRGTLRASCHREGLHSCRPP